jgi:outer membrane protein TolC
MLIRLSIIQTRLILLLGVFFMQVMSAQQQNLDYFLTLGLQNSPLLLDYQNRLKSALIDSMRLRAGQGFQINAGSFNTYAPVIHGWGYDEVKTDIAQISALMGISKEITGNNNLRNQYQAIRLQNQSTDLEGSLSEKELKKTIISQYILAYGDQQQLALNSEVLDILRQEELIVKKLTEQGVYKQTEYLSLLVNLRQQALITSQIGYKLKTDFESLKTLCGIFDTSYASLSAPDLAVNISAEPHKTIFIQQFEIDSLKLINADQQIDFNYRPKLSVYADGGYLSSLMQTPWKNFGFSAGFSLTVPVYDGHQKKMQHDQLAISEATRMNYHNFFINQYHQLIVMLTRQLTSNDQLARQTREQLNYAQALVDANRLLLNSGDISVTDYLISITNYLTAKNLLIENILSRFKIINELNYWSEK